MRRHGGAKTTDPATGRFNFSQIFEDYITQFISSQEPLVIARAYKEQRDRLAEEMRSIEAKARQDLGTTIDDFLASHDPKALAKVDEIREKARTRRDRMLNQIQEARSRYTGNRLESWLKARFPEELKALGMTSRELATQLDGTRS